MISSVDATAEIEYLDDGQWLDLANLKARVEITGSNGSGSAKFTYNTSGVNLNGAAKAYFTFDGETFSVGPFAVNY